MSDGSSKGKMTLVIKLRNYFTTGLLVVAPTAVTVWILTRLFFFFDHILGQFYVKYMFEPLGEPPLPGLGAVTLALLVILIGMFARMYAGRKLLAMWDRIIEQVPLVNRVYIAIKQLSDAFAKGGGIIFQHPVIIEYPRRDVYSIGFVTNHCSGPFCKHIGKNVASVFVPTTPNPTSGVLIFVPEDQMINIKMSVEDAMKLVISAGTVTPELGIPIENPD